MIELVGESGYEAVALRKLTTLAGVSTRTFYQHFEGKEDCFLRTYELVMQRIAARVASAQAGESNWSRRVELALQGLAAELINKPRAARLALLEIFAAGSAGDEAVARTEDQFEEVLAKSLAGSLPQVETSPLLAKAIVSGVAFVARTRMVDAGPTAAAIAAELSQWVLSLQEMPVSVAPAGAPTPAHGSLSLSRSESGEREALLAATAKLAAADGYWELTMPRILAAAGLRKNNFTAQFTGVEDCFLAVLEQRMAGLVGQARTDLREGPPWSSHVHCTIENLCAGVASDSVTAKLTFIEARSAGRAAVALQDGLLANLARELLRDAPAQADQSSLVRAEASLGAMWEIVRSYVESGRDGQLPGIAPILTFLFLAPFPASASPRAGRRELENRLRM
jgi:AcrR family transcriptional regulator